jgi:uncharacterized protein YggE
MVMASIGLAMMLAAQPVTAPVTVEIVAIGHSDTPANKYVLAVEVTATGDTDDKAKAAVAKIKASLLQQLGAAGVTLVPELDAPKVETVTVTTDDVMDGAKPAKPSATDSFSIQADSRAAITRAQDIIGKTTGASANQPPTSSITDVPAAARAAKRDAIAKAKLDAQNYAEALGYATATPVSLTERGDFGTIFTYVMRSLGGGGMRQAPAMFQPSHGDTVAMDVTVTVTFRLEGKK